MKSVQLEDLGLVLPELAPGVREGEPVLVYTAGELAAVVLRSDPATVRTIEDALDNAAADTALAEPGANIPWETVEADLGLPE